MTENVTLELDQNLANNLNTYIDELGKLFGKNGYGPDMSLYYLKVKIQNGQLELQAKKDAEKIKNPPAFKTVMCNVPATSKFHDCWILHKPSKTVYYAPFGHHYQIIEYLQANHPGVIDESWTKHTTVPSVRTGDVKHGNPRTASENPVTSKKLRPILINAYNEARGMENKLPN